MPYAIAALGFAWVITIGLALSSARGGAPVLERWRRLTGREAGLARAASTGSLRRILAFIGTRGVRAGSRAQLYERLLEEAGRPFGATADELAAVRTLGLFAAPALGVLLTGFRPLTPLVAILLAFVGYQAPVAVLRARSRAWRQAIQRELITFLDLLALTVEVRDNLGTAIDYVCERRGGVLGETLRRRRELAALHNQSLTEMLRALAKTVALDDFTIIVNAIVTSQDFGTPLAETLRQESQQLKIRRVQVAEERAGRATGRLTIVVVGFFVGPLLGLMLGPAVVQFFRAFAV